MEELQQQQQQQPDNSIRLVMVSIGVPEKAQQLVDHLDCFASQEQAEQIFFVDPDNQLYDALDLNRGIQRLAFNLNTPFAFLDRLQQKDGLKDLGEVLSKWSRAFFIPPKQAQALLQGGTFVFAGNRTVYAHYDPSTAAHASIDRVLEIARRENNGGGDAAAAETDVKDEVVAEAATQK